MAIMARASAKISAMLIAVKIFGAADGFLPKAFILANTAAAITPEGPRTHKRKISNNIICLAII
jgi:hypothetical protein